LRFRRPNKATINAVLICFGDPISDLAFGQKIVPPYELFNRQYSHVLIPLYLSTFIFLYKNYITKQEGIASTKNLQAIDKQ
tara:strand:- start:218 stop:460 length:243 start_codon:yes stop_codon:yes gene_type:complete